MADKKAALEEWQQYPIFTELLTDHEKYADLREKCLKSCQELDEVIKSGGPNREAAQDSLNAFGFALGLLDEAIKKRDEMTEQG